MWEPWTVPAPAGLLGDHPGGDPAGLPPQEPSHERKPGRIEQEAGVERDWCLSHVHCALQEERGRAIMHHVVPPMFTEPLVEKMIPRERELGGLRINHPRRYTAYVPGPNFAAVRPSQIER